MVFPYRTPATIEPDLSPSPCPSPYLGPGQCAGCSCWSPHPRFFYAQIASNLEGAAPPAALRAGLDPWLKAVSAAGVFFLGTASVAMMTLALRVTHPRPAATTRLEAVAPRAQPLPAPRTPAEVQPSLQATRDEEEPSRTSPALAGAGPALTLNALGQPTHAPEELWARASKLVVAGVDIVLTETRLADRSVGEIERELHPSARILPARDGQGIQISILPSGSIAWAAGLSRGDVVTAVNGYALSTPDAVVDAYASVRQRGVAVIEVRRRGRPVVLKVSFAR